MDKDLTVWLADQQQHRCWSKRLSGNDTQATGAHQAGPYIPRDLALSVFPSLDRRRDENNPRIPLPLSIDSHDQHCKEAKIVWYNNKFREGSRNEIRITGLGGKKSALLDPENTGAMAVFAFARGASGEGFACHVWICRGAEEDDIVTDTLPEKLLPKDPYALQPADIDEKWLQRMPTGQQLIDMALERIPSWKYEDLDKRLTERRKCEYAIFLSIEAAHYGPKINGGFKDIDDFTKLAQTVLQSRKTRSGRSLELHIKAILLEDGFLEGQDFDHQGKTELNKRPDFLFPSSAAYGDDDFPEDRIRMLAVKTNMKDRWRQMLNEANRIKIKHLFTLQPGISQNQFEEATAAGVRIVTPKSNQTFFAAPIKGKLQTLSEFIQDLRSLRSSPDA